MKFLIDECLSPRLASRAVAAGYAGSSHVVWLGRRGAQDWELKQLIIDEDWTFVTRNSVDFRGPTARAVAGGHYSDVPIHAGLICLNGPEGMNLSMQLSLFDAALDEVASNPDLVNQVLELSLDTDGGITVLQYELPRNG